jgi:hypothetical protein
MFWRNTVPLSSGQKENSLTRTSVVSVSALLDSKDEEYMFLRTLTFPEIHHILHTGPCPSKCFGFTINATKIFLPWKLICIMGTVGVEHQKADRKISGLL